MKDEEGGERRHVCAAVVAVLAPAGLVTWQVTATLLLAPARCCIP